MARDPHPSPQSALARPLQLGPRSVDHDRVGAALDIVGFQGAPVLERDPHGPEVPRGDALQGSAGARFIRSERLTLDLQTKTADGLRTERQARGRTYGHDPGQT